MVPGNAPLRDIAELNDPEKHWFIYCCDLDCDKPYCEAYTDLSSSEPTYFAIPQPLAHYLSTHYCGSQKMYDQIAEQARAKIIGDLFRALGVEGILHEHEK